MTAMESQYMKIKDTNDIAFTKKNLHQKFISDIFLYNYYRRIVFLTFLSCRIHDRIHHRFYVRSILAVYKLLLAIFGKDLLNHDIVFMHHLDHHYSP